MPWFNLLPSLVNPAFVAMILATAAVRALLPVPYRSAWTTAAMCAALSLASLPTLALVGGVALLVLFPLGQAIHTARHAGGSARAGKWLLIAGTAIVLMIWVTIKAYRQWGVPSPTPTRGIEQLAQAVGFSYFLFRAINYLYMRYLMPMPEAAPWRVLAFSLFLPTLTSGPIQKYPDFARQYAAAPPVPLGVVGTALFRITQGYFYKVCIAAALDQVSTSLLSADHLNVAQTLGAIACLYLFVYFDFAGYSHIAIGLGSLLGFTVPENFKNPFGATSVTEFWRNWHVTIGDWFRDQVFIPQGGMRMGGPRASWLSAGIMLLCGLWHGFTLSFVAWGIYHASLLFIEGRSGTRPMPPAERHGPRYWLRVLWTNARIAFCVVFFVSDPTWTVKLLKGLITWY